MKQITFTAKQQAALTDAPDLSGPLAPGEVRGRTLVSLVSPGTELNSGFLADNFPRTSGYACVFQVEEIGPDTIGVKTGDRVFFSGAHRSQQQAAARDIVALPESVLPEQAVFARLAAVSMSTLNTTTARPPCRVLVTGLGPIGNLAAQVFSRCGYQVTATDPSASRRESARQVALTDVRASVNEGAALTDQIQLHVECSGHEQAVLDGARVVRCRGEVVLVGVPWKRHTDLFAFDLLHAIFHRWVVVRSGWEWEVPHQAEKFNGNSLLANYAAAISWIAEGSLSVDGLARAYSPEDSQKVYSGLLDQSLPAPAAVFDWR